MSLNCDTVSSEQLGHLGLVAATIRELGIIEKIDARLDLNERKGGLVTYGRRVAAMMLNGLGFMLKNPLILNTQKKVGPNWQPS